MQRVILFSLLASLVLTGMVGFGTAEGTDNQITATTVRDLAQDVRWLRGESDQPSEALIEHLSESGEEHPFIKCGMSIVTDYKLAVSRARELGLPIAQIQDRPVLDRQYDSPAGLFRIHYTTTGDDAVYQPTVDSDGDGVPDYTESVAVIADSVYYNLVTLEGYPAPPSDGDYDTQGGDGKYDIYVRNLSTSVFGLTYPDSLGYPAANQATTFIEIDNDYQSAAFPRYLGKPLNAVRVTIAHEYYHAVQFGMDYQEHDGNPLGGNFATRYWMEMSSVWMEEHLYDEINDYYSYLDRFYDVPLASLQQFNSTNDLHPYASVVFPLYLSETYGDGIVKAIWDHCADLAGPTFFSSVQAVVDSASTGTASYTTAFRDFALWNYFTGERATLAPSGIGFEERDSFPTIPEEAIAHHIAYPFLVRIDENRFRPAFNGAVYINAQEVRNTRRRFWECIDPIAIPPCDSQEVFDTTLGYDWIDSTFTMRLFYDFSYNPWGLSVIYQLDDLPDSFFVEQFMLPIVFPPGGNANLVNVVSSNPETYRTITYIITPAVDRASPYYEEILAGDLTPDFGYRVREETVIDSSLISLPSAVLMPYPNPAVVNTMSTNYISFAFQLQTDSASVSIYSEHEPYMQIDIFTIAGERVATLDDIAFSDPLRGRYTVEWNMKSAAGSKVASGAYLAIARLWSSRVDGDLLAEDKVKVAIIR